ncbi:MAG: hypothetical protein IKE24_10700 [Clostridia bacterium]|nr:hypothetical protein [Clostridia bacterium]
MIGYMQMPADFPYAGVYAKGRPQHSGFDAFRLKHPLMDYGKRAKIFSPFDALKGFSEAVASKEIQYENRRDLDDDTKEDLNRKLGILHRLTINGRASRENRPVITVTFFVPCDDPDNAAYGCRGQYLTVTGPCVRVGMRALQLEKRTIPFRDIAAIRGKMLPEIWEEDPRWEDEAL